VGRTSAAEDSATALPAMDLAQRALGPLQAGLDHEQRLAHLLEQPGIH